MAKKDVDKMHPPPSPCPLPARTSTRTSHTSHCHLHCQIKARLLRSLPTLVRMRTQIARSLALGHAPVTLCDNNHLRKICLYNRY